MRYGAMAKNNKDSESDRDDSSDEECNDGGL